MELGSNVIARLFVPDALTPAQYYSGLRAHDLPIRPIKRLMLAVLEDAMRCYQTCGNARGRARRRLFAEAEAWLLDHRADGPFAFETICQTLGIDPGCLRSGLRHWRVEQLGGSNPRPLARRSPVTREGRISAPLRRQRLKGAQRASVENGSGTTAKRVRLPVADGATRLAAERPAAIFI